MRAVEEARRISGWNAALVVAACFAAVLSLSFVLAAAPSDATSGGKRVAIALDDEHLIAVAPPPFSKGIFPCSDCHDGTDVNTTRRIVDEHEDIVLEHDAEHRWCLDCHDAVNRDKLHLADGRLLNFTESYQLCGQCHGPELRDWKAGVHGKRTGLWSGRKEYLLCVHCHNPHAPRFKPLEPLPAPVRPENLR